MEVPSSTSWSKVCQEIQNLKEDTKEELKRALVRFRTALLRGGAAGLTLRGGLHLLSTLLWILRNSKQNRKIHAPRKRELTASEALMDTLRYTMFLAALGGSYVAVDEGLAILLGKQRTAPWRALVAGAIAGHTVLLTGPRTRHYSLATYLLLRGVTLLIRCGNKPRPDSKSSLVHTLLTPTRWRHGDVLLMCLASSQIVYSYIMMPETLPVSYVRFLNKMAAKEPYVWRAVKEQALANWRRMPPRPLSQLHGTAWQQCTGTTPCEFWHPGQDCTGHALSILPSSYLRSLGVYIPVYLLPALVVHRQKLLQAPVELLPKILAGIARSSLFLTSFIALAFGGACIGFNTTGTSTGPIIAASTALGGLATFVEKKSRRMELALYVSSRAVESFARCLHHWGLVPEGLVKARLDVLIFSAGCAAIMHCYSDACGEHRGVFRSKYLNVLDFVFGNTGVSEGSITHRPSNLDLIQTSFQTVHRTLRSFSTQRLDTVTSLRPVGGSHDQLLLNDHHYHDHTRSSTPSNLHPHGVASTSQLTTDSNHHLHHTARYQPSHHTSLSQVSHVRSAPAFNSMHASLLSAAIRESNGIPTPHDIHLHHTQNGIMDHSNSGHVGIDIAPASEASGTDGNGYAAVSMMTGEEERVHGGAGAGEQEQLVHGGQMYHMPIIMQATSKLHPSACHWEPVLGDTAHGGNWLINGSLPSDLVNNAHHDTGNNLSADQQGSDSVVKNGYNLNTRPTDVSRPASPTINPPEILSHSLPARVGLLSNQATENGGCQQTKVRVLQMGGSTHAGPPAFTSILAGGYARRSRSYTRIEQSLAASQHVTVVRPSRSMHTTEEGVVDSSHGISHIHSTPAGFEWHPQAVTCRAATTGNLQSLLDAQSGSDVSFHDWSFCREVLLQSKNRSSLTIQPQLSQGQQEADMQQQSEHVQAHQQNASHADDFEEQQHLDSKHCEAADVAACFTGKAQAADTDGQTNDDDVEDHVRDNHNAAKPLIGADNLQGTQFHMSDVLNPMEHSKVSHGSDGIGNGHNGTMGSSNGSHTKPDQTPHSTQHKGKSKRSGKKHKGRH